MGFKPITLRVRDLEHGGLWIRIHLGLSFILCPRMVDFFSPFIFSFKRAYVFNLSKAVRCVYRVVLGYRNNSNKKTNQT